MTRLRFSERLPSRLRRASLDGLLDLVADLILDRLPPCLAPRDALRDLLFDLSSLHLMVSEPDAGLPGPLGLEMGWWPVAVAVAGEGLGTGPPRLAIMLAVMTAGGDAAVSAGWAGSKAGGSAGWGACGEGPGLKRGSAAACAGSVIFRVGRGAAGT